MQLCLHVHQHGRVPVSIYVCAMHVSLLGPFQEASVVVYLYVYVGVGMRMTCAWAWACHHHVYGHESVRLCAYGCVCVLVSA